MAGESILIIDDSPLNLKLARILLESQHYTIGTAKEGKEALSMASTFKPQLILMDIQMPGMDGLEVTRRIKANPDTRDIMVVALTSYAMKGDEEKARSAGCDGYITKPFDSQKLLLQIRQYLDARPVRELHALTDDAPALQAELVSMYSITQEFLVEGEQQSRRLCEELETGLRVQAARRLLHQWAGTGGTLGFPQISQAAFDLDTLLEFSTSDVDMLETRFKELLKLFSDALEDTQKVAPVPAEIVEVLSDRSIALIGFDASEASRTQQAGASCESIEPDQKELLNLFSDVLEDTQKVAPVPAEIVEVLSDRSIALIGFDASEASQTQRLLQQAGASCESVEPDQMESGAGRTFDIAILKLTGTGLASGTQGDVLAEAEIPVLLVGPRELVIQAQLEYQSHLRDFLIEPYSAEEILLRCCQLALRSGIRPSASPINSPLVLGEVARSAGVTTKPLQRPTRVLIADDDPTVVALVRTTLHGYEVECLAASHAGDVVRMAAEWKPDVIVLDVNMPQMDGFEVLASIKNDDRTKEIAVVMLTARQQELDILKGFGLGAADYIVKPFSPLELVARIRRLVRT